MLRFFNNYHKSVVGVIVVVLICISMLFFGVGLSGQKSDSYAIKVNDSEISFSDFYERKRRVEQQYQRMFGERFYQMRDQFLKDLGQKLSDGMVDDLLIEQKAKEFEMFVGENEVRNIIATQLFPDGYSTAKYTALLAQNGMSSRQFEAQLASDALKQQFRSILQDVAAVSNNEARNMLMGEETDYDLEYVELKPADFEAKVAPPSDEELKEFFESNATDYEQEAKVKYSYLVFRPEDYEGVVEVSDEDVELYYTDNERKFTEPEQVKVRHIQLNYPTSSEPEALNKVKSLAQDLHAKVQAGEDISTLAELHSDDVATKLIGGDLGWIKKGDRDPAFEKAAFDRKEGGLADLVEEDYGFHIVYVDEYREARPKEIDEVRPEIIAEMKKVEAPAYTSAIAQEKYDEWLASGKKLEAFAKENNLKMETTDAAFPKGKDPAGLMGITAKILKDAPADKQLVEAKNATLLVEVEDLEEAHVAELDSVREKVLAAWKKKQSKELVRTAAMELVQGIEDGKTLKQFAEEKGYKVWEKKGQKLGKSPVPPFTDADVRTAVLGTSVGEEPSQFYKVGEDYLLFKVTAKKEPASKQLDELLPGYRDRAEQQVAQNLTQSILNNLRSQAEIDVSAGVLTN